MLVCWYSHRTAPWISSLINGKLLWSKGGSFFCTDAEARAGALHSPDLQSGPAPNIAGTGNIDGSSGAKGFLRHYCEHWHYLNGTIGTPNPCAWPVAPVVQVVSLEFYVCLSPGFEPQVGGTFDFIRKNKNTKDSIVESALQRG